MATNGQRIEALESGVERILTILEKSNATGTVEEEKSNVADFLYTEDDKRKAVNVCIMSDDGYFTNVDKKVSGPMVSDGMVWLICGQGKAYDKKDKTYSGKSVERVCKVTLTAGKELTANKTAWNGINAEMLKAGLQIAKAKASKASTAKVESLI